MIAKDSRANEPIEIIFVDEEHLTICVHCGTRTELEDVTTAGALLENCPHCGQHYEVEDDLEDDSFECVRCGVFEDVENAIEKEDGTICPSCDANEGRFEPSEMAMKEASQDDLNHLFGIKPGLYGDEFGSF